MAAQPLKITSFKFPANSREICAIPKWVTLVELLDRNVGYHYCEDAQLL